MSNNKMFRRLYSAFSLSAASGRRRRSFTTLPVESDHLETRRLLSGTNQAPEITSVTASEGMLVITIDDDESGGALQLDLDLNDDGSVDYSTGTTPGDSIMIDLTTFITPNTSMPATITLTETLYDIDGMEVLTDTEYVSIPGLTVTATEFTSFFYSSGQVAGSIDASTATGAVHLVYREVGSSVWIDLGEIQGGGFDVIVSEADGERDFEFATDTRLNSVSVLSSIVTVYDLESYYPSMTQGSQEEQDEYWSEFGESS